MSYPYMYLSYGSKEGGMGWKRERENTYTAQQSKAEPYIYYSLSLSNPWPYPPYYILYKRYIYCGMELYRSSACYVYGKKQKAVYHPKPWQLPTNMYSCRTRKEVL